MKSLLLSCLFLLPTIAISQDPSVKNLKAESERTIEKNAGDTLPRTWRRGGIYGLNISQGSLSNWAAGGDNFSFSVNSLLSLYAFYKKGRSSWDNTFDFNLGYVKTTSLGNRKNDDRFDLLSKYGYALNPKLSVAGLFNFRSQLFKGYRYPDNVKTYSSTFLAPAYLLLGVGLDYKPAKDLSVFISPATIRWVIVKDTALANKGLYGVEPGKKTNVEFGAFATINYLKDISKNITYKGRLDLFSNYLRDPGCIDIYMSNILNMKFSKALAVTWGVDLIYDNDVKMFGPNQDEPALQVKSLIGIGLLVKFE